MKKIILKGRKVVGGTAEGEALVTKQSISPWGGVDAEKGIITERRHELRNQSFVGKVLVFPSAKGSSGWSTVTQVIRLAGKAPKALIIRDMNSLAAIGSVIMGVPAVTDLDQDPTELISTGDWVWLDADKGIIKVMRKDKESAIRANSDRKLLERKKMGKNEGLPFSNIDHVGVIVNNLEKAIAHYECLGIGPFAPLSIIIVERKVLGKPIDINLIKNKVAIAKMGPINIELIQPVKGDPSLSLWMKFLKTRGEGINHLGFRVDDLQTEMVKLEEKGFRVLHESRFQNGGGAAYFETGQVGEILFETFFRM